MSNTKDWESLMNGVFGSGGRLRPADTSMTDAADPFADLQKALLDQQRELDARLKAQSAAMARSDAQTQQALEDSRAMLKAMEEDGLLAKGSSEVPAEQRGSFAGLAAEVKKTVLGQDAFVDSFVRAMRRPFVYGAEGPAARNVILVTGSEGTGRHFTLDAIAAEMARRTLLNSSNVATMDLGLYPNPGAEKLFLQDLYAALHAPGEIVAFENYADCHPGFLKVLSDLCVKGSAPLSARYVVNNAGYLVDAGTALVPGAVSRIDPCGKYLIFFSEKGREAIADKFGSAMVSALGDVCATGVYTAESLQKMAAQNLNALAQRVRTRLNLTMSAGADVRDHVAAQCTKAKGAGGLVEECDRIFRALSEYCLLNDLTEPGKVALAAGHGTVTFAVNGGEPASLYDLLPGEYKGMLDEVQAEMDKIVGLDEIKEYVTALADNVRIRQRRTAAGMKNASLSMHMIFTGNPGTGKTTIARIVARYLKAIGALSGGQLIEVSRADLVGRYSGHTAPLTNSVIASALGGVLFIDEAYSLYRGEQDSFGLEAIDTLVKGMEDHRDELVVILAGYSKEMAEFLTSNSGLASRFPNTIEFPDYTAEELLKITHIQANSKGYVLDEACDMPLLGYYTRKQAEDAAKAGNGRLARNTVEAAILNQSRRLVAEPDAPLERIIPGDFELED